MQEPLPLSWARSNVPNPVYRNISLPLSGIAWITYADLPYSYTFSSVKEDLEKLFPEGFLIRGCSRHVACAFEQQGGALLKTGAEAVLHLQNGHFEKKSLRKLLQQAEKKGEVVEMPLDNGSRSLLRKLQRQARHGSKPQLSHVFRTYPFEECRCFVLLSRKDEWLAAVTVTFRDDVLAHTELMLKQQDAPPGTMELLLAEVFRMLREEGFSEWSLGEVPFYHLGEKRDAGFNVEEKIVALTAELCRGAYDFRSLFYFKNKFDPEWRDVYLYSKRGVTLLTLADLAIKTGYTALVTQGLLNGFIKPFSS